MLPMLVVEGVGVVAGEGKGRGDAAGRGRVSLAYRVPVPLFSVPHPSNIRPVDVDCWSTSSFFSSAVRVGYDAVVMRSSLKSRMHWSSVELRSSYMKLQLFQSSGDPSGKNHAIGIWGKGRECAY